MNGKGRLVAKGAAEAKGSRGSLGQVLLSFKNICASMTLVSTSQSRWGNAAGHGVRGRGLGDVVEEGQGHPVTRPGEGRGRPSAPGRETSRLGSLAEDPVGACPGGPGRQSMALGHRPAGQGQAPE